MDSLTQIILGAACGEAVLGKKIGNRAMIWGGIGGTLPDLDVLANFFLDPLSALVFHRGPMHSLMFALIMPFILGPLLKLLYDRKWHERKQWKITGLVIGILFFLLISFILCLLFSLLFEGIPWILILVLLVSGFYFFRIRSSQIFNHEGLLSNVSSKDWTKLFFWSIFTHPLLDSLTTYGTVLFWPFSNFRISLSSVSIVDPLYTIPFAFFLLLAALQHRENKYRRLYNWIGIGLSSSYLIFTFINKQHINQIFENSLKDKQYSSKEYITVPTIFNNLLWYAIAKQDSGYIYGYYSLFDKSDTFTDLHYVAGNHNYFDFYKGQKTSQILPWFSDGYYSLLKEAGKLQYNDLRFGSMSGKMDNKDDYIFKFNLVEKNGILEMERNQERPENKREDVEWFKRRIFGESREEKR